MSTRRAEEKFTALVSWRARARPQANDRPEPKDRSESDRHCHRRPKYRQASRDRHAEARVVRCRPFFCETHERLGSDSEVVMLEQKSEGMRGPCVTSLNDGPTAYFSSARGQCFHTCKQSTGNIALSWRLVEAEHKQCHEMSAYRKKRRGKERRPSMSHAGSKSRFSPQRCSNRKEMEGSSGNLCGREVTRVRATAKSFNDAKKLGRHADLFFFL